MLKNALSSIAGTLPLVLAVAPAARADSTFFFNASQPYRSIADSPLFGSALSGGSFHLENFENGSTNALLRAFGGTVRGPSASTDSVDGDDGAIDGSGQGGHSYSTNGRSMTFKFKSVQGHKPTMAGLVFTDGRPNSMITFRAWDANGNLIGKVRARLGDLASNGGTAEDRFFGIANDEGIARFRIQSSRPGFEVDHLQFAYGFSVVPVPPALGLGLAGLAAVGLWKGLTRRRAK
jgi:hypothetical protein